jgi:hypothetical protein
MRVDLIKILARATPERLSLIDFDLLFFTPLRV